MNHGGPKDAALEWYHGKISRSDAEKVLTEASDKEDGLFLVRESNTARGDYGLSVLHDDEVMHIQIRRHGEDAFFSLDGTTISHGLETLIEYYQTNDIVRDVRLTKPVLKDPPPHDTRRHGTTNLLHRATKEGNYIVVSELLKCEYRSLDAKNQDGQTAVHLASIHGKDDILKRLIESNANINVRDMAGYTPLHYACRNNKPSTVRILVDTGRADIQIRHTETGHVPLHEAARMGHADVITVLLSLNAPAYPRSVRDETPADLARINRHYACEAILRDYQPPTPRTKREAWYHGTLDRKEANHVVLSCTDQDGAFLVRYSTHHHGEVLTVQCQGTIFHYTVQYKNGFYFIDSGPYHNSLEHVIDYYTMLSDGLPTTLQLPIPPKPKPKPPELPPNGIFSTLPLPRKYRRNESLLTATLGRSGMQSFAANDPPELGIPKVPPLPTMHSAPLSLRVLHSPSSVIYTNNSSHTMHRDATIIATHREDNDFISPEQLTLGDILGEGEFGSVYKGKFIDRNGTTRAVAIKTLRHEHVVEDREKFLQEARVMMSLQHPHVVQLIGISHGPPLQMVQELVPLGSMLSYLLDHPEKVKPDFELKLWAAQIAWGMKYLEEKRYVHRDLAARNILLATQHLVKISDFGLSRSIRETKDYYKATQGGRWPIKWYAPESFNFGTFTSASDVWGFGVTLWEMFSYGEQPYGEMRGIDVTELVERGERLPKPVRCPDSVYRIMEQCWAYQPRDRPSFSELAKKFGSDQVYTNIEELILDPSLSLS